LNASADRSNSEHVYRWKRQLSCMIYIYIYIYIYISLLSSFVEPNVVNAATYFFWNRTWREETEWTGISGILYHLLKYKNVNLYRPRD